MRLIAIVLLLVPLAMMVETAEASSSFRFSTRSSGIRAPRAPKAKINPGPVTGFKHATCRSATCFQKHPTGEYMIPLHAKAP